MNIKKAMTKKANSLTQEVSRTLKPAKSVQSPSTSSGNGTITLAKIKEIAKSKGINPGKMKKAEIIKTIQRAEGNFDCFGTATAGYCDQHGCFWITECLGPTNNRKTP